MFNHYIAWVFAAPITKYGSTVSSNIMAGNGTNSLGDITHTIEFYFENRGVSGPTISLRVLMFFEFWALVAGHLVSNEWSLDTSHQWPVTSHQPVVSKHLSLVISHS